MRRGDRAVQRDRSTSNLLSSPRSIDAIGVAHDSAPNYNYRKFVYYVIIGGSRVNETQHPSKS